MRLQSLVFAVLYFWSLLPYASEARDEVVEIMREMIQSKAEAKRREASHSPAERRAHEQFAIEARGLDQEFADLWATINTTEQLLNDYGVSPLPSKLEDYAARLTNLMRRRSSLEERMEKGRLDQRDCWADHDFVERNYIAYGRKVLASLSQEMDSERGSQHQSQTKAIQALNEKIAYCRSAIEAAKRGLGVSASEPISANDLDDLHQNLATFNSTMLDIDRMVDSLDLAYADVFQDRDDLIAAERALLPVWKARVERSLRAGQRNDSLALAAALPWRRLKLMTELVTTTAEGTFASRDASTSEKTASQVREGFGSFESAKPESIALCCLCGAGTLYFLSRVYAERALRRSASRVEDEDA